MDSKDLLLIGSIPAENSACLPHGSPPAFDLILYEPAFPRVGVKRILESPRLVPHFGWVNPIENREDPLPAVAQPRQLVHAPARGGVVGRDDGYRSCGVVDRRQQARLYLVSAVHALIVQEDSYTVPLEFIVELLHEGATCVRPAEAQEDVPLESEVRAGLRRSWVAFHISSSDDQKKDCHGGFCL